jgi:hypothetical protein
MAGDLAGIAGLVATLRPPCSRTIAAGARHVASGLWPESRHSLDTTTDEQGTARPTQLPSAICQRGGWGQFVQIRAIRV